MADHEENSGSSYEFPEELENGLRNYWYPILMSEELSADKPLGIRRLGENLVVWRGADGTPNLFVDHCPHRGAPLSLGLIEEGRLECWYHGLVFDEKGKCRFVPAEGREDGPLSKNYCVKSYPVEERAGFIWGYIGDVEMFPPPPLTLEPEIDGPDYHYMPHYEPPWNSAWPLAVDNANDPSHVAFLHRSTATSFISKDKLYDYFVPTDIKVDIKEGDIRIGGSGGCVIKQIAERKVGTDEFEHFLLPSINKIDVTLPGPEGVIRNIHYIIPIDKQHTQNYWHVCKQIKSDADKEAWEKQYEEKVKGMSNKVYAQDRLITEKQGSLRMARSDERMLPHDTAILQIRRLIMRAYKAQQDIIKEKAA